MKTNITRLICLLLTLAVIFAAFAGCEKRTTNTIVDGEDETFDAADDETTEDADDADDGDTDGDSKSSKKSSKKTTSKSSKSSTKTTSVAEVNSSVANNEATVKENQKNAVKDADSLSQEELIKSIPKSLKGKTVTVMSWNPIKDVTGAETVVSNFEKQTGIKVEWKQKAYENYDSEIVAAINSGNSPDIIRYFCPAIGRMALTQDAKSATGYDFKGSIWDKNVTSAYTVKGKIYGVNLKNTFNQQPMVVAYAQSTIDRYKLEDPYELWKSGKWTFDKFKEICREFKAATNNPGWMTSCHLDYMFFSNIHFITFNGKEYINNTNDSKFVKAMQECANMRDDITCGAMREPDKLENGTYLFNTDNILTFRRTDPHYSTLKGNDDLYCVPVPTQKGKTYYQHFSEYEAYGFPKGCKNGAGAYFFLRYYLNKDNYDANTFFNNKQTMEVYNWCMSQNNIDYTIESTLTKVVGNENADFDSFLRTVYKAAQVQNKISEMQPLVKRAVQQANKTLNQQFK